MRQLKRSVYGGLCIVCICFLVACQKGYEVNQQLFAMDAPIRIQLHAENQALGNQVVSELDTCFQELDAKLSNTMENSDVTNLNEHPQEWILVDSDTSSILQQSMELSKKTEGAFDPMIGRLSTLWNINGGNQTVPLSQEIEKDLASDDYQFLLGPNDRGEYCVTENAQIDLGAVGKGYATDRAAEILRQNNIDSALVNMGSSSMFALGKKADGRFWTIAIQDVDSSQDYFGILSLEDQFLSTSGDYEHYFMQDGVRYHHIIDPETGYPANSGLRSVTVVGDNGVLCEVYSTALFVMGLDQALSFYHTYGDFEAVLVTDEKEVYVTEKLQEQFEFTGNDLGYTYYRMN